MRKKKVDSNWPHKLYAHPHDGVTDIYRDREMTKFVATDPCEEYKAIELLINNDEYDQENIMKEYNELLSRKAA